MHYPRPSFPRLRSFAAVVTLGVLAIGCLAGCSGDNVRANLHALVEKQRLVGKLQQSLLLASDAENNVLLSPVEADAKAYAATTREALAAGTEQLGTLDGLVQQGKNTKEIEALNIVSSDFKELSATYDALLGLLGRNTNVRAAQLSRSEASQAVLRLQQALGPIIDSQNCAASKDASRVITAALSILALHPRHIDESTAAGMDALEASIGDANQIARTALAELGRLPDGDASLREAARQGQAAYAAFWELNQVVVALSRENTNVEAAALSMGRKRLLQAKILSDVEKLSAVISEREFSATR
ncbi:hypothetical protein DVDV_0024 [Desulfovibrio sp. DV]|uniref:hypothetical protein n=1 Tax=Desulfovibrio sp. DV TaxID=1844708 RepID=UPI00094BB711|nr:hypothetical protein [Desulfovibrio sp. DV]OLN31236.1 hypothetical protein DVDV_0024 [Desulfovibrio sp. DV]